jgi:ATP-binding cassette subfamily C protein LapB
VHAWFRDTLKLSKWLYSDAILASFLINLLGLMVPLFVMQTYDRVVPNQATSTLWVLAIGLLIGTGFELVLRVVRAHLLDTAGKKTDVILSATLFERITGMAMKARPATIGGFAQSIHDFQGLREFLTAVTLTSLIDLPFVVLMLVVIGLLGGWLVVIPVLAFPITIIFALAIQVRLRDTVQKSLSLGAERQALLIETLGGLETLKACSAESERQHKWESTPRRPHPPRQPRATSPRWPPTARCSSNSSRAWRPSLPGSTASSPATSASAHWWPATCSAAACLRRWARSPG